MVHTCIKESSRARENDGKVDQPISPDQTDQRCFEVLTPILESLPSSETEDREINKQSKKSSTISFTYANVTVSKTKGITQKAIIHPSGPATPPQRNGTPGIRGGFTVILTETPPITNSTSMRAMSPPPMILFWPKS
jgi:hypothetical protein